MKIWGKSKALEVYLKEVSRHRILSREEERELLIKKSNGDKRAKERLLKANLRFSLEIALDYSENSGFDVLDLIQEGNEGLLKAIERYDPIKYKVKLISYAVWWIRQYIRKYMLKNARLLKVSASRMAATLRYNREKYNFFAIHGRFPIDGEVLEHYRVKGDLTEFEMLSRRAASLDAEIAGEPGNTLADLIPVDDYSDEGVERDELGDMIDEALKALTEKEVDAVRRYHGLYDGVEYNLEETGAQMNISRERVRQLNKKGMERLRKSFRLRRLREFRKPFRSSYSHFEAEAQTRRISRQYLFP
jgi:RNA polymerase primary sigma factor